MQSLSKACLSSLCDDFAIVGERAEAFSKFATQFESEWEIVEDMSEPLGPAEVKRISDRIAHIDAVADMITDISSRPDEPDRRPRFDFSTLPLTKDGGLDIDRVYWEHGLPRRGDTKTAPGAPAVDLRAVAEILRKHGAALVHHCLRAESRGQELHLDFAPDNEPKQRGRPANGPRTLLIRRILDRHQSFLEVPVSYADGQPFVRFCERLLEAYGIDSGDTAQLIKRELERRKAAASRHDGDPDLDPYR